MSDLAYPKNGGEFLLQTVKSLHANIADLIDELVKRDQTIAQQAARIGALTPKPDAPDDHPPQ